MSAAFDLTGRTAIITGSSTGNGRAIAIALAEAGADIVGVDLSPSQPKGFEEGEPFTHDLVKTKYGVKSTFIQGDVTQEATWELIKEAALALTGRIDILVSNAGILGKVGPLHEATLTQWQTVMAVNVQSVFLGVRAVIPTMLAQEAREGGGALVAMNRALAVDYGRQGIKCVTVSPGIIATALMADALADPNEAVNYKAQTPWPRFGRVDEVGSAVLFLASDASDYCNGSDFGMDAGYNIA